MTQLEHRKRKARSFCFQKALQRHSLHKRESTIRHGSKRPQTETIRAHHKKTASRKIETERGIKPQRNDTGDSKNEQPSNRPVVHLSKVQRGLRIKNWTLQPPTGVQELTLNLPKFLFAGNPSLSSSSSDILRTPDAPCQEMLVTAYFREKKMSKKRLLRLAIKAQLSTEPHP